MRSGGAAPRSARRCARRCGASASSRRATPIWCWSATARTTGACRSRPRRCWRGLGLRLHTVGVGDPERSMPIPIADDAAGHAYLVHDGQEVQTRMRNGLLIGMADAADGVNLTAGGRHRAARAPLCRAHRRPAAPRAGDGRRPGAQPALPVLPAARGGPAAGRAGDPPLARDAARRRGRRERRPRRRPAAALGRPARVPADPRRRIRRSRTCARATSSTRRASTTPRCARYEAAAEALPESAPGRDDRLQPGQRAVQEPSRGAGARPLSRRADHRGPGAWRAAPSTTSA